MSDTPVRKEQRVGRLIPILDRQRHQINTHPKRPHAHRRRERDALLHRKVSPLRLRRFRRVRVEPQIRLILPKRDVVKRRFLIGHLEPYVHHPRLGEDNVLAEGWNGVGEPLADVCVAVHMGDGVDYGRHLVAVNDAPVVEVGHGAGPCRRAGVVASKSR